MGESFATWTGGLLDVAQIAAIILGGWWAYFRFIRQREGRPRASLKHNIQHFDLDEDNYLVHVSEEVTNSGQVLLQLVKRTTRVQRVLPPDPEPLASFVSKNLHEVPWFQLTQPHEDVTEGDPPEIEPGETDHFDHDFIVPRSTNIIQIYSHFWNATRAEDDDRGWAQTTLYDLRREEAVEAELEDLKAKED